MNRSVFHDHQYSHLQRAVLYSGTQKADRTGTGTVSIFDYTMRFNIRNNVIPVLTTKKMHWPSLVHELLWYISGASNIKYLRDNGVRIWNEWSTKEGHLNKVYGYQWRHWETNDYDDVELVKFKQDGTNLLPHTTTITKPYQDPMVDLAAVQHLWQSIMTDCMVLDGSYFVDDSWKQFDDFVRGIHDVVGFTKWKHSPNDYVLSPEYFGSKCYGPRTAIFVPVSYYKNMIKSTGDKYVATRWTDGTVIEFTCIEEVAGKMDISSATFRTEIAANDVITIGDWTIKKIVPPEGHAYRQKFFVDQLADVIDQLRTNPDSRRLMVNAWNVGELSKMKLPPCHYTFQFYTEEMSHGDRVEWYYTKYHEDKVLPSTSITSDWLDDRQVPKLFLSCKMTQRSADVFLGVPFNIAQYSMLTCVIAKIVGMAPRDFIWSGGDCHIYANHVDQVLEQLSRAPFESPTLGIADHVDNIDNLKYDDFYLINYASHGPIKATVAV